MNRTLATILLALACSSSAARAQAVQGVVLEDGSNTPVEGAMVVLHDFDGTFVARVLTDASGSFIARADHPGVFRIRVDRIGYESLTTERFDVPVTGTFQRVIVPIRAVELSGIRVEGSRRCQLRSEQGQSTARVWEEARKALQAAAWTLESGAYRYTLLQFERTLDANRRTPRDEQRRFVRGTSQAPYVSSPAEVLVEKGFIRENEDQTFTYFAPDAEAFLSDAFLNTHCMRLAEVKDGRVGLAFEPVPGRRTSDIKGTLWLHAASATLERLDFTYVNQPPDRGTGEPGGRVVFGRLPNGTWIVREWSIQMPILTTNRQRTNITLQGYEEQGGIVWRVIDRTGTIVVEATTASISGIVLDSTGTQPIAEATVRVKGVEGPEQAAVTQNPGTFLLPGLPEGLHNLEVRHPSLDTLGLGPVVVGVDARAGEVTPVRIRLPGVGDVVSQVCSGTPEDSTETAVLLGRVQRGAEPAAGAVVRIRWLAGTRAGFESTQRAAPERPDLPQLVWSTDPSDDRWIVTSLDARGIFLLCGIPTGRQLQVEVTVDDGPPSVHTATMPYGSSVVTLPIVLKEESES